MQQKSSRPALAKDVQVSMIGGWYLENNLSIFRCVDALELGIDGSQGSSISCA